jgi:hypothetical protein
MRRRDACAGLLAGPAAGGLGMAWAQPAPRRVGVLAPSTAAREAVTLKPFFDEMERLG